MRSCGQACPYNTLNGCKVKEYNGICPLANMALADMEAVKAAKPQTNADRIRAMSDEELARFAADRQANETYVRLTAARYKPSAGLFNATREILYAKYLYWLRQPVKDGEGDGNL